MFNFTTICESVRRHCIAIVLITALALVAGAGSSFVQNCKVETAATYSRRGELCMSPAMAMTRMLVRAAITITEFNENTMMNDVRRIIVSKEVAAQIREEYGEDITITTPDWKDTATKTSWTTRFCFIDVTGGKIPTSPLKVADEVANKVRHCERNGPPGARLRCLIPPLLRRPTTRTPMNGGTANSEVKDSAESVALAASA